MGKIETWTDKLAELAVFGANVQPGQLVGEEVAHICRLDADDPPHAWAQRSSELKANAQRLTEQRYDAVRLHGRAPT